MTQAKTGAQALKGWDQVIQQLLRSPDRPTFMRRMLDLQCKIVAAEYGLLWERDAEGQLQAKLAWPESFEQTAPPEALLTMLKQSAEKGFEQGRSCVLEARPENLSGETDQDQSAHVFVTTMRSNDRVQAVTTVLGACRDKSVLQQTAPLRELAASLYEGFEAKLGAQASLQLEQRMRRSVALLAVCQSAEGFKGSCFNFVNEVARQMGCDRVSLGWVKGESIKLVAMSDTEHLKRHSEQVALVEMAMSECLDQEQPLVYPLPPDAEPLLKEAVVHAHRRASSQYQQRQIVSVPLREGEEWVGVLTLEGPDEPLDAGLIQQLQLIADVVSPHLADRYRSDRSVLTFAWYRTRRLAGKLVGPRHVAWKLAALLACAVLLYVVFGTWTYRVSAPFTLEAEVKRVLPAPFEGNLAEVYARVGDSVEAGDPLARLSTYELQLERNEALARLRMLQMQKDQARSEFKTAEAQQAAAGIEQVRARLELLTYEIEQARINAPIAGKILQGEWQDRVGGLIEKGEAMFEIAPIEHLVPIVRVHERDIDQVAIEASGMLATKTEPDRKLRFTVDRVVPLATTHENENVFEVYCRLDEPPDWLRPNMTGTARIDSGRRPVWWILTHEITDMIRLWMWW